jgi:uncharacterized membrane protein YhhN
MAFSIPALAFVIGIGYLPYPGAVALKALPILILVGVAWRELQGRVRLLMVAALLLSAGGDVLLELNLFAPGVGSFLLAQLCYAGHFSAGATQVPSPTCDWPWSFYCRWR